MDQDRYEILEVVGSGGMATVWRARDTRLGRLVAVKRPSQDAQGAVDLARFAREARAAATVAHPHVVAVHDAGIDETGPYLVMELVQGPSLATAEISDDRVAEIGAQVASALAALHAAGVVHGDVKPGNILLAADGAKLADFGIASAADDTVTLSPGATFGTPAYAAPETLTRGERSAAADVYSLAAVIHELLTGSRWNAALGSTQAMPSHHWTHILEPALAADPAARPTAAAFAANLATLTGGGRPPPPTTLIRPTHPQSHAATTPPDPTNPSRTGRVAVAMFAGVLALTTVLVVALTALDDGGGRIGPNTERSNPTASATPETSHSPTTSILAAATTVVPTASTSASTVPATTVPAPRSASDVAAGLIAMIDAIPPDQLKPNDAKDLVKRINDVVRVATDEPNEASQKLRDAAEHTAKSLDDDITRARAEDLLTELATALGIDTSTVAIEFDRPD